MNNFSDYERRFGGLALGSNVSYAVRDFFLNGGGQAIVVRVAGTGAAPATANLTAFTLAVTSPGTWGNAAQVKKVLMCLNIAARIKKPVNDLLSGE